MNPILLFTPADKADLGTFSHSVILGQGWPTQISVKVGDTQQSTPITYLDKDVIEEGQYVHPKTGQQVHATRQQLKDWKAKFDQMSRDGVLEPSIPCDHKVSAESNLGFVKAARLHEVTDKTGKKKLRLNLTHAFIGEDAPKIALRNRESLGIDPDYVDGKGKKWGSVIVHSAITPDPVVAGMGPFTPSVTLSRGQQAGLPYYLLSAQELSPMKPEHKQKLCKLLDMDAGGMSDDDLMSRGLDEMEKQQSDMDMAHNGMMQANTQMSRMAEDLQLARDTATSATLEMSRNSTVTMPDANSLSLLSRAYQTEREAVINLGGMDEATAKEIDKLLMPDGKLGPVALSRNGDEVDPLAFQLLAALKNNKPVNHAEQSGIQLSRHNPGTSNGATAKAEEVAKRMLEKANQGTKKRSA